ncbi:hypothetical protein PISMIDRAFT_19834 [Pisolithus microcarpus 441]|uniref:Uncharacterized protein n=1 Tax=Pisolithus microcarpus 441 TaxID=765257 RepID=A0A0C9YT54_9AGAM|nr:hypothetical protein PISMIDRAFT_19834 [Pisolithus microcarpus 441]
MKSLPNSTNGQRFLRIFNKDNQDFLEMGLDATFGLQVLKVSGFIVHTISAGRNPLVLERRKSVSGGPLRRD